MSPSLFECLRKQEVLMCGRGYHITLLKDATAGFTNEAKDAATELIWPLFANEVLTVAEWIEKVGKK